jgi:branched-chain amino acid aminotransferase
MTTIYCIDGQFVDEAQARIPVSDLAILRGYGVFDYLRTYGGRPFHLQAHLERLQRSADLIGLALPQSLAQMTASIEQGLDRARHGESAIRIVVTGGDSPDNITPVAGQARVVITVTSAPVLPADWYSQGIKVITHTAERYLPEAKTLNYIPAIVGLQKAMRASAVDALYLDAEGHVLEGTTTNLFAFFGDTLVTPAVGILRGITRLAVIQAAADVFDVQLRPLPYADLLRADEVFLTSSNKEVCPVRQVDDSMIGSGQPGARTRRLLTLFRELAVESPPV